MFKNESTAVILSLLWLSIVLAFWIGVVVVILHFVLKYW
jgi:hypothetical protein